MKTIVVLVMFLAVAAASGNQGEAWEIEWRSPMALSVRCGGGDWTVEVATTMNHARLTCVPPIHPKK